MRYVCDIKFGKLQVRENAISLRIWSGGATAQLRTLEGALQPTHKAVAGEYTNAAPHRFRIAKAGHVVIFRKKSKCICSSDFGD